MMEILKEVIRDIRPEKGISEKCEKFVGKINSALKNAGLDAYAVLGGSIAKGTFLKNDYDCDVFVKFSMDFRNKDISGILENALKDFQGLERIHGSRDYFQISHSDILFEIVPVLDIKNASQAANITDCSPLHVDWVKEQLNKNPGLSDEIRLAKAFFKAQGAYGAESYIKGFSGHVIDIIVIYYSSFIKFIENAAKWKKGEVIDFYNYYNGNANEKLNKSKLSPLIVIDPIQPERNAAAVLSNEKFLALKQAANDFMQNPSKSFFKKKKLSISGLKKKAEGKVLFVVHAAPYEKKSDISGSMLLKAFDYILKNLASEGFELAGSGWEWDKKNSAVFWFILSNEEIPEFFTHTGPPLSQKKNVKEFMEKHRETFVSQARAYAKIKRKFTKAGDFFSFILKDNYIKEKIKNSKIEIFK